MQHTDQEIQTLSQAIRKGDTAAFTQFYDAWFTFMLARARRCTGRDEAFCLDIVQDACVRVIKSIKPLPNQSAMERWLNVVVRSCAYDRLRSEVRRKRREQERSAPLTQIRPPIDPLDEGDQQLVWLGAQMRALPDADLRLLALRYRMGWTLERIGRTLSISPGAVEGRLSRILRQFRRGLP